MRKFRMIALCFLCLGILDLFAAYAWPMDYTLEHMSFVPHFYFIGMLVYVYNKPARNRLLLGFLTGLLYDFFVGSAFPTASLSFPAAAWLSGLVPAWSNSPRWSWLFFAAFALAADLIPWLVASGHGSLFRWLWHMEAITLVTDILTLYVVRYGADVMDRYFKILHIRMRQEEKRKLQAMRRP